MGGSDEYGKPKIENLIDNSYLQESMMHKMLTEQTDELVKLMEAVVQGYHYPSFEASDHVRIAKKVFVDWVMSQRKLM